jgi:potassium efflux system protein
VLAEVDLLKPLNPAELTEVAKTIVRHVYAPGETVIKTGDIGDSMFIIHRGTAEVLAANSEGQLRQVAILEPRSVIGEMALFTGDPRRADVRALQEIEILEVHRPVIQQILRANSLLAEAFSQIIGKRQTQLALFSEARIGNDKAAVNETILQRIKRFFSLS